MKRRVKIYGRLVFWLVIDFPLSIRQLASGVLEISFGTIRAPSFWRLLILELPKLKDLKCTDKLVNTPLDNGYKLRMSTNYVGVLTSTEGPVSRNKKSARTSMQDTILWGPTREHEHAAPQIIKFCTS
jgi:hypothetical protein